MTNIHFDIECLSFVFFSRLPYDTLNSCRALRFRIFLSGRYHVIVNVIFG